jgi:hypothetical protein
VEGNRWGFGALNGLGGPTSGHILASGSINVAQSIERFRFFLV